MWSLSRSYAVPRIRGQAAVARGRSTSKPGRVSEFPGTREKLENFSREARFFSTRKKNYAERTSDTNIINITIAYYYDTLRTNRDAYCF